MSWCLGVLIDYVTVSVVSVVVSVVWRFNHQRKYTALQFNCHVCQSFAIWTSCINRTFSFKINMKSLIVDTILLPTFEAILNGFKLLQYLAKYRVLCCMVYFACLWEAQSIISTYAYVAAVRWRQILYRIVNELHFNWCKNHTFHLLE